MRTGEGFLVICAVDSPNSATELESFVSQILRVKDTDYVPLVVAINKMDLDKSVHKVTKDHVREALKRGGWNHRIAIFETSAKTNLNITAMVEELIRQCLLVSNVPEIVQLVIKKDKDAFDNIPKKGSEGKKKCIVM